MAKKIPDIEAPVLPAEAVGEAVQAPTEPAEAAVKAPSAEAQPAEDGKSGIYMYIGPNIKGLIQTGTIYRGTREDACEKAKDAIAKHPLVKSLIVSGEALPQARLKVKTPGNVLYANYQKLAGK